ncbi:MAG: Ig-like domain-containing protein [Bacillota bacterium]|jgi:hypothetical protein
MKGKHFWIAALVVVVVVLFAVFLLTRADEIPLAYASDADMQATVKDAAGVDTASAFNIKFQGDVNASSVRHFISVEPEIEFAVHQGNNKQEVLIAPAQPLDAGTLYKFTLLAEDTPLSWAFETKSDLAVSATLPAGESTNVPLNSSIEIYFDSNNIADIKDYFHIEPAVEGDFQQEGNTVTFIPRHNLLPNTIYNVTIKSGLAIKDSDQKLAKDYAFSFQTQMDLYNDDYWDIDRTFLTFNTKQTPAFKVDVDWTKKDNRKNLPVKVYAFASAVDFADALDKNANPIWANNNYTVYDTDKDSLTKVLDIKSDIVVDEDRYSAYIVLPQSLPAGYYLLSVERNGQVRELLFQVSDINAYALPAENEILFWLHDINGLAISGAAIREYNGANNGKTNQKGLLKMPISSIDKGKLYQDDFYTKQAVYIVEYKDQSLVLYDDGYHWHDNAVEEYWSYVYSDKKLYKAGEQLNFWGFVQARAGYDDLKRVRVSICSNDNNQPILHTIVPVEDNTFSGDLTLPTLSSGYYSLVVTSGKKEISQLSFQIADYIKPTYRLESQARKQAIMVGEEAIFDIYAKCFENTPLPGLEFSYYIDDAEKRLYTDEEGYAQIVSGTAASTKDEGPEHAYPLVEYKSIYARAQGPESGDISTTNSLEVLKGSLGIKAKNEIKDGKANIWATVYNTTLDKVNKDEESHHQTDDFLAGVAPNKDVKIKYYRMDWLRKQTGQSYDNINKVTIPIYEYDYQYTLIDQIDVKSNSKGLIKQSFNFVYGAPAKDWGDQWQLMEGSSSFVADLIVTDSQGRIVKETCYFYPQIPDIYQEYYYNYLDADQEQGYQIGETFHVDMKRNNAKLNERKNSFLFVTSRSGIKNARIQDSPTFIGQFLEEYNPNMWLSGVYFDGNHYYATSPLVVKAAAEQFALDIDVSTDKNSYKPGDTVDIQVKVSDKDGAGKKAKVLISVVDEALFAVSENYSNILEALYDNYVPSDVGQFIISHGPKENFADGGGGAGDEPQSMRDYFADSVIFKQITTDNNGKGKISLELPDNITSWRISSIAVNNDYYIKAGQSKDKIISTLPFWGEVIANNSYLAQDNPTIFLRALGQEATGEIKYDISLEKSDDSQVSKKYSVTGPANKLTALSLGQLADGQYNLTVNLQSSEGHTDSFVHPLTVTDSFILVNLSDQAELNARPNINHSQTYPTVMIFSSKYRGDVLSDLWHLCDNNSTRIESRLSVAIASQLLHDYDSESFPVKVDNVEDLSNYQRNDGGIAMFPYGSTNLLLSVQIASLDTQYFDNSRLKAYFYSFLRQKESRQNKILALSGLAALGEPVLQDINNCLAQNDLSSEEKLYLYWGMAQLGDIQPAKKLFTAYLEENSQTIGSVMSIKGKDTSITATGKRVCTAMMIAASCGDFDHYFLLRNYLLDVAVNKVSPDLPILFGCQTILPQLKMDQVSFSFKLDGTTTKVTLKGQEDYRLLLLPEQVENISFSNISGSVKINSLYKGIPDLRSVDKAELKRSYTVDNNNGSGSAIKTGTMKITLSYKLPADLPQGSYTITDCLPAGLRFLSIERASNEYEPYFFPVYQDGQRISFSVYKPAGEEVKDSISYYSRVISGGTFNAETAVLLIDGANDVLAKSGDNKLNIKQ